MLMDEAGQVAPADLAGLLNPVPAERARLRLAHGDLAAAARWVRERELSADDEPGYASEPEHLVPARVLLAQHRPGDALALLERWLDPAAGEARTGSIIQLRALMAMALAASGDQNGALESLAVALSLACPHGYIRVFADEGAPMGALLGRLAAAQRAGHADARGVPPDYLARIQAAFEPQHVAPVAGRPPAQPRSGSPSRHLPRTGRASAARRGQDQPAHRPRTRGHPRHRQEARQPPSRQARCRQPDRSCGPGTPSWA